MSVALRWLAAIALMLAPIARAHAQADVNLTVLIIRHAEPDAGQGLSPEGMARAEGYAHYFRNLTFDGQPLAIGYLFAARDTDNSRRPGMTLQPTATALGLTIDDDFKTKQVNKLARVVGALPKGAVALVAWRHSEIPDLLSSLGADPASLLPGGAWPNKVFDWLLVLRFDAQGKLVQSRRVSLGSPQ